MRGLGNKGIGTELGIGEQAVKEHVSNLFDRFGVSSRAALAEIGTQLQILGTTDDDLSWLPYLFIAAPIGMQVFRGPDHRVVAINETARKAADHDVVGVPLREAYPLTGEPIALLLDRVLATGERHVEYEFEGTWVRDGKMQASYSDFVLQPITASDGTVTGVVLFGADVSDRVLARRHAEQLSAEQLAVFDLMNEGVMVTDAQGRVLKVNDAYRRLIGLPEPFDEMLPKRVTALRLRDPSGRELEIREVPLLRAIAGETIPWTEFIAYNPVQGRDIGGFYAAAPMRAGGGAIIGGVLVVRPRREGG